MSSTDYLGNWEYLGTITPQFDVWTEFPTFVSSSNSIVRATYYGNFNRITSRGYLRAVYRVPDVNRDRRWFRLYPKPETEIFNINIPQEIILNNRTVQRYYEVIKRSKYTGTYSFIQDNEWSIALESLNAVNLPQSVRALAPSASSEVIFANSILFIL